MQSHNFTTGTGIYITRNP